MLDITQANPGVVLHFMMSHGHSTRGTICNGHEVFAFCDITVISDTKQEIRFVTGNALHVVIAHMRKRFHLFGF